IVNPTSPSFQIKTPNAITLIRVRQVESALLILLAAVLVWSEFGQATLALNFPLLAIAVLLASRNLGRDPRQDVAQLTRFDELLAQGSRVYNLYQAETTQRGRQRTPEALI